MSVLAAVTPDSGSSGPFVPQFCHYCNYFDEKEYLCDPADPNVCEPCRKLSDLEEKIKETRRLLVGLANERRQLKTQVNRAHDRIIHRLPLEVAANIFELCLPDDVMDLDLADTARYAISAPFILSAVCKQWRSIAHSLPQLWKTLLLCGGEDSEGSEYHSFPETQVVRDWIEHAGNQPLSISLCVMHETKNSINLAANPKLDRPTSSVEIIGILNQYSDRWLQLKYDGPSYLLSCMPNDDDLLQLRRLHLQVTHGYTNYSTRTDYSPQSTLSLRPKRLNALSMAHLRIDADSFDWQHLTELELGTAVLSECFAALQGAPNLTRCIFSRPNRGSYRHMGPPIIVHPNIQYLEITGVNLYQEIIKYLSCSSLKTLVLSPSNASGGMSLIIEFLERSGCFLENFSISGVYLSDTDIDLLCQSIPTLQHLEVQLFASYSAPMAKNLITRLTEFAVIDGREKPRYLPLLHTLVLSEDSQKNLTHWRILPEIFGTPSSNNDSIELHRPLLKAISVSVRTDLSRRARTDIYHAIGLQTLERILWLEREAGVGFELRYGDYGGSDQNLIDNAVDYYENPAVVAQESESDSESSESDTD